MQLFRIQRSPDGETPPPPPTPPKSPRKKRPIPEAEGDIATLAQQVAAHWSGSPLTLIWTNADAFSTAATTFRNQLLARRDTGALRPGHTYTMNEIEEQIEAALREVKVYIQGKFKTAGAAAQYPRYGMVHRGDRWIMPPDRDDLRISLNSMITAIAADGFGEREYGTAFWTGIKANFDAAFNAAKNTDGAISGAISDKNEEKEYILKTLKALLNLLEANYPDSYEEQYRLWGFQVEDY